MSDDHEGDDAATRDLLRAAFVLARGLLRPLQEGGAAGHHVTRVRVFLATLGAHLEGRDGPWLAALRSLDADLHRLALDRLRGRPGADAAAEAALAAEHDARVQEALRAADRATFGAREVDLFGAALLTGLARGEVKAAIDRGELAADDDGQGPRIALAALAAFAAARGLPWRDGLGDDVDGAAAEAALQGLLGGAAAGTIAK